MNGMGDPHECPFCRRKMEGDKPVRSYQQHKRFFAMCEAAFEHWPETHPRQFPNKDHCRKYLEMKAGWYVEASRMSVSGFEPALLCSLAEAMFRAAGGYAIAVQQGDEIAVFAPKSISYRALGHKTACQLFDKVSQVIGKEIGISGDDLLENDLEAA